MAISRRSPPKCSGAGSKNFYGAVGRVILPVMSFFADLKLGFSKENLGDPSTPNDATFGYGVGVGYSFDFVPMFSIRPRVGFRNLPYTPTGLSSLSHTFVDLGVLLSFSF